MKMQIIQTIKDKVRQYPIFSSVAGAITLVVGGLAGFEAYWNNTHPKHQINNAVVRSY